MSPSLVGARKRAFEIREGRAGMGQLVSGIHLGRSLFRITNAGLAKRVVSAHEQGSIERLRPSPPPHGVAGAGPLRSTRHGHSHPGRTAAVLHWRRPYPVSYTHLRAHETDSYLVCRLLLEKKKK